MSENKINTEEAKAIAILLLAVLIIGLSVAAYKKISKGFSGLFGESEESKFNKQFSLNKMWNPNTWKVARKGATLLKVDAAKKFAKQISDSWGILNDDEQAVYNVFRQLKTPEQVSEVADFYQLLTGKDLYQDLFHRLSDSELSTVNQIVSKLK